jgi:hypothetical protein
VARPTPEPGRTYDLGREAAWDGDRRRTKTIVLGAAGTGLVLVGFAALRLIPGSTAGEALELAALLWGAGAFAILVGLTLRSTNLIGISVDTEGITFRYRRGRTTRSEWSDPALGLTLLDYSADPYCSAEEASHVELLTRKASDSGWVSAPVAEDIARTARSAGVAVVCREESFAGSKSNHRARVTRIGQVEGTPGQIG